MYIYIYKYVYFTHTYVYYTYRNYNPPHIGFSNRFKGCPCCCISCLDFAAWIYWWVFWHDGTPTCKSDWCLGRGAEWEMKITKHELYIMKNMYVIYLIGMIGTNIFDTLWASKESDFCHGDNAIYLMYYNSHDWCTVSSSVSSMYILSNYYTVLSHQVSNITRLSVPWFSLRTSGLAFGFSALVPPLLKVGAFHQRCDSNSHVCQEQLSCTLKKRVGRGWYVTIWEDHLTHVIFIWGENSAHHEYEYLLLVVIASCAETCLIMDDLVPDSRQSR